MRFSEGNVLLQAADAHNVASSNSSVFEDVSQMIGNVPNFLQVSVASGLNSFYNTGVALTNIFRPDEDELAYNDTGEWISSYDEDLGKYYDKNKDAADLAGFIASSFIPGGAAIKGVNMAQKAMRAAETAGSLGSNMSRATKLLTPSMEVYVKREAADLATKNAAFSIMNSNARKAIVAGAWQGVLEGVAFETVVAATMFKSPILDDMDGWDIMKNIAFGGVAIGGAVGGVVGLGKSYFGVKALLRNADARQQAFTGSTTLAGETRFSDRIVQAAEDRAMLAVEPSEDLILAQKLAQGETGESISPAVISAEVAKLKSVREANLIKLNNEIRENTLKLTAVDDLGNQVADITERLPATGFFQTFFNVTEMARLGTTTKYEQSLKDLHKAGASSSQAVAQIPERALTYLRLHSGAIGDVVSKSPGLARLADKMTPEAIDKLLITHGSYAPVDFRTIKNVDDIEARWLAMRKNAAPLHIVKGLQVGSHDLPMLDKVVRDGLESLQIKNGPLLQGRQNIKDYFIGAKEEVLLAQKSANRGSEFLERVTDIRKDWIEGAGAVAGRGDDYMFATTHYARQLSEFLSQDVSEVALAYRPTFAKTVVDTVKRVEDDGHFIQGAALIGYRQKLAKERVDNIFSAYAGQLAETFPEISDALIRNSANRYGSGGGKITNAGGEYGSLAQMASYVGGLTSELTTARITATQNLITPLATKLATNPQMAVRFSGIKEIIANQPEKFVLNSGGNALIPRKLRDYQEALEAGVEDAAYPTLVRGTPEAIPLEGDELIEAVQLHISLNGKRNADRRMLNNALGETDDRYDDTFYPWKPNPRDHKHVAFVKDETLVGVGHTRMLFASTAADLEAQITKVRELTPQYKIYTTNQAKEFYRVRGEYEYDKTLHENYVDTDMLSRGIYAKVLPTTDPTKIVNEWMASHIASDKALVNQMVMSKYEKQIGQLKRLAEQYGDISTSRIGRFEDLLGSDKSNPYIDYVKSMLNTSKVDEWPFLRTVNEGLDGAVSRAWRVVDDIIQDTKGTYSDPQKIEMINSEFEKLGFQSAYYDATLNALANSSIPRGSLTKFVRTSNAFLTATVLRLDPFNALNNLLGNTVLFSTELNSLMRSIREGGGAGALDDLSSVLVPGTGDKVFSASKLIANSHKRLFGPNKDAIIAEYTKRGLNPDLTQQLFKAFDTMTLNGAESVAELNSRTSSLTNLLTKATQAGERVTGNRWVEQFNRVVAADVAKQIVDVAVGRGLIDEAAGWAYVNTFVNRVNGVIRAAERPLMFQGPIGQSIGLFQSYQFNLMQQTLRYIGEGRGKQLAMLAGLQSSIYGASSLPGFNLINNSLIGNAAGNTEHKDLFSSTEILFGKDGAEWLMYGIPSNVTRASLYSRGDTNPRVWSIVPNPTNPSEIPFISSFAKAATAISDAVKNVQNGGDVWNSILGGVEHLGFSRPMAGIAQTVRSFSNGGNVISTQKNASMVYENDLASWATLTRLGGAKPIDEAIMTKNYFRIQAYAARDNDRREALGTALKTNMLNGTMPAQEDVDEFARKYAELGGKQSGFNRWFTQRYKDANQSQAEQLANRLNSPYAQQMQLLMGGRDNLDDLD